MTLTKKLEKELLTAYNVWFNSYANGEIPPLVALLTDDFNQIGSAVDEVFFNKTDAVKFLEETIDQLAGKTQIRNQQVRVDPMGDSYLVTDLFDIYVLDGDDWSFYSKFRSSTLMQKLDGKWKFLHQHSSMPDSRTEGGDNLVIERINEENRQLREAVQRRTIELEQKSRDLEIESALERVRAVAMGMHQSDDLARVGETIFTELKSLGLADLRNSEVIINHNTKNTITSYYFSDYGVSGRIELDYTTNPILKKWAEDIKKASNAFSKVEITKDQIADWRKYRVEIGYLPDPKLDKASAVYYYSYSTGMGALSISSFSKISEDQVKLLERFRNVFTLAYQRYLDVAQAEVQAREARIEAALERVRSRSMGMQKSEELKEVIRVVYEQLVKLDVLVEHAGFIMDYKERDDMLIWLADQNGPLSKITIPYFDSPHWNSFIQAKEKGSDFFSNNLNFEEKNTFYKKLFEFIPDLPTEARDFYFQCPGLAISTVLLDHVGLYIENFRGVPFSDDENEILMRFGKVFQQTYTRFLDLEKAEEQAREGQIQLALERVRARTMAMQKSEELGEAAAELFLQINQLIPNLWSGGFVLCEKDRKEDEWWFSTEKGFTRGFFMPNVGDFAHTSLYEGWVKGEVFRSVELEGELLQTHYDWLMGMEVSRKIFEEMDVNGIERPSFQQLHAAYFSKGYLAIITTEPSDHEDIFKRFARVFDLVYTRFLDLQKAEEQARESRIEAALERVRARTMAMHKSEDLNSTVATVFAELEQLGFKTIRCGIGIFNDASKKVNVWTASEGDKDQTAQLSGDEILEGHPLLDAIYTGYKNQQDFSYVLQGEELISYYDVAANSNLPVTGPKVNIEETTQYYHCTMFPAGGLFAFRESAFSNEAKQLMRRFADVFHLTFIRHLDLMHAEAQAREAEIEAALERVRSKTLAMHNSQDVGETVTTLFEEIMKLGIDKSIRVGIGILAGNEKMETWSANTNQEGDIKLRMGMLDMSIHPMLVGLKEAWQSGKKDYRYDYIGEDVYRYYEALNREPEYHFQANLDALPENEYHRSFFHPEGILFSFAPNPIPDETAKILARFAHVFGQTYRRYRDLLKAEAQSREAQIEAALDRIRAAMMAMHQSDELRNVIAEVFAQLQELGFDAPGSALIIYDKHLAAEHWMTGYSQDVYPESYKIPYTEHPYFKDLADAWQNGSSYEEFSFEGELKIEYADWLLENSDFARLPDAFKEEMKNPAPIIMCDAFNKYGMLEVMSPVPLTEDEVGILKRVSSVFEQTYTRFLDLKKAEAQAREARIEVALERTRTQSMLMQHSSELEEISKIFHEQLLLLDIPSEFSYVWLPDEPNEKHLFWATWEEKNKGTSSFKSKAINYDLDKSEPYTAACFLAWESPDPIHMSFIAPQEVEHFFTTWSELIAGAENLTASNFPEGIYYAEAYMKYGCFGINIRSKLNTEEQEIIRRFAIEFERTYTRFLDLKKAEEQARQSQVEAAMERVRARALAMQKPEELKAVADVMREEMGKLGVEELETSSIYINDESPENAECWYAIKDIRNDQKILVTDYFSLNLNDTWVGREMLKFYQSEEQQVSIRMTGDPRVEWIRYCEDRSIPLRGYYGKVIPDRTYHLYKFSHGAIGAATAGTISEENWNLLKRAASAFSLAYSRFKDLTQARIDLQLLKEEKKRAEDALANLEATQEQLVHAEKMASLGELTAGIAHEIQNPLNFVNNFSEVNAELIEELKEELEHGELEEVKAIADDILGNEAKIRHHGKRADDIVKGMLQHSRTTSGKKQPTDINELADEFLRLAYHGLRAKDKSFNADFKTDLDKKLPKVQVISQDIGRVLLNLVNNAFYAVDKRAKQLQEGYKPEVVVSTKLTEGFIEIRVKDNGSGIPGDVLNKIFQPFFTTKPTGEGTGLGLSLSYDIITKGHGGKLNVETKENKGTEFIISLPVETSK